MQKSPAFQFYPKDFISDKNVILMSAAERGCYIMLLCHCWINGSIPASLPQLCRLCAADSRTLKRYMPAILACFVLDEERGVYTHPRLDKERIKQENHRLTKSEAGKKGMESRWKKPVQNNNNAMSVLLTKNNSSSASTTTSTTTLKDKHMEKPIKKCPPPINLPDWLSSADWQSLVDHRKEIKSPMSDRAKKLMISNLENLRAKGENIEECINQTIMNNWKSVFPDRNKNGSKPPQHKESYNDRLRDSAERIIQRKANGGSLFSV